MVVRPSGTCLISGFHLEACPLFSTKGHLNVSQCTPLPHFYVSRVFSIIVFVCTMLLTFKQVNIVCDGCKGAGRLNWRVSGGGPRDHLFTCTCPMLASLVLYDGPSSGHACHPFHEKEPWAGSRTPAVLLCGFVNVCHPPGVRGGSSLASPPFSWDLSLQCSPGPSDPEPA